MGSLSAPKNHSPAVAIMIALLMVAAAGAQTARAPERADSAPVKAKRNVLLVISDGLSKRLGCYGDPVAKTPHIDRLSERGIRFDAAICQHPPEREFFVLSGLRKKNKGPAPVWLPEYFHRNGYFTAGVGRIDDDAGTFPLRWSEFYPEIKEGKAKPLADPHPLDVAWGRFVHHLLQVRSDTQDESKPNDPDRVTIKHAVEILDKRRDQPFLLAVGIRRPHLPFVAPTSYYARYPLDSIRLPKEVEPDAHVKRIPGLALDPIRYFPDMPDKAQRHVIQAFLAATSFVDAQVGLLMDALDRHRLWDNTIVVLTSYHGFQLGEHGLWEKRSLFQENVCVPMIVCAPGRQSGVSCSELVELVDLYPTLAQLCGLPLPGGAEGTSFVPLLENPALRWKRAGFAWMSLRKGDGTKKASDDLIGELVRTQRYVYHQWPDGSAELYDLQIDPKQYANLRDDPAHVATVVEMKAFLKSGWQSCIPQ